jgi:predicted DNA-binding protein (UPF0251 family)
MYRLDVTKLNRKIVEKDMTKEGVAAEIGIDRATFYRRLKTGNLRVGDMQKMVEILQLSGSEAIEIFLAR